jgi:protein-tyrosine phosphatase
VSGAGHDLIERGRARVCPRVPPCAPVELRSDGRSRSILASVIDLHCHVLPGIDDGPPTLEDSLDLARVAEKAGFTSVVATPHVSWRYLNGPQVMREGVDAVRRALRAARIDLEVLPGAEIEAARLGDLSDEELSGLHLGDGPWLMIEAPLTLGMIELESVLEAVHHRGHWIVLAHPERSPLFLRNPRRLQALVSRGVLCSITASSLVGAFGREVRSFALALAREGLIHNVTSDAHDAIHRPPVVRSDVAAATTHVPELLDRIEWLTSAVPRAILDGDPLPTPPAASDAARPRRLRRSRRQDDGLTADPAV